MAYVIAYITKVHTLQKFTEELSVKTYELGFYQLPQLTKGAFVWDIPE